MQPTEDAHLPHPFSYWATCYQPTSIRKPHLLPSPHPFLPSLHCFKGWPISTPDSRRQDPLLSLSLSCCPWTLECTKLFQAQSLNGPTPVCKRKPFYFLFKCSAFPPPSQGRDSESMGPGSCGYIMYLNIPTNDLQARGPVQCHFLGVPLSIPWLKTRFFTQTLSFLFLLTELVYESPLPSCLPKPHR